MEKRELIKRKLSFVIKDMTISSSDLQIPMAVENYILETCGWSIEHKIDSAENLNDFVVHLQNWIEGAYSNKPILRCSKHFKDICLPEVFEKNLRTGYEYIKLITLIIKIISQLYALENKFAILFRNKSELRVFDLSVSSRKLNFLEYQFFLRLYRESNALSAHWALRDKLKTDIEHYIKLQSDAMKQNSQFEKVKNDRKFIELCRLYKEFRKMEIRSEIIKLI